MTAKRLLGFTAFLALASLTAGCGGDGFGNPVGGSPEGGRSPVKTISGDQLDRAVGLGNNQTAKFLHTARAPMVPGSQHPEDWSPMAQTGQISSYPQHSDDGYFYPPHFEILMFHSEEADDFLTFQRLAYLNSDNWDMGRVVARDIVLGDDGAMTRIWLHVPEGDMNPGGEPDQRIYLPSEGSDVQIGAYSGVGNVDGISFGIFGKPTPGDVVAIQSGYAEFTGFAEAAVTGTLVRDGSEFYEMLFSGETGGSVDYSTGEVRLSSNMASERTSTQGRERVSLELEGTMELDGLITGAVTMTGFGLPEGGVEGVFEGHAFGPRAEQVGGTYGGVHSVMRVSEDKNYGRIEYEEWANFAGHLLAAENGGRQAEGSHISAAR